ncbi:unnamed protein product [Ceutorhynchus assimilis]|uniref:Uncharacterized protein n=1 Tax=Ceutorhynchus assimilis TaxID=467358 RepID=A0A9N9M8C6_9CUCU|nr:unnamed protein product [Ceutorhynchus assimilis]
MESQAISPAKMNSKEFQDLIKPWIVMEKLDDILNNKSEAFERKVQALIEVWKSVSELDFSKFRIQNIIKIVDWAKLHALDIVLNGKWRSLKGTFCDDLVKYIGEAQAGLASRNNAFSSRCEKLADVVRSPWEHPVLYKLINIRDVEIGPEEMEFFCVETIYLVSVRLKKLCENRCQDLALNLSTNYLKYKKQATLQNMSLNATDTQLWFIFDIHIALLYKYQEKHMINKELKELPLEEGVLLVRRFTRKRVKIAKIWCNFEKIAMYGCRFFLAKALTCEGDAKQAQIYLLKTYLELSNTETLLEHFILSVRNFTKLADAAGLFVMCEVIHREGSGSKMFHFAIEMFIRAITADMNEIERLKQTNEIAKIKNTSARLAQSFEYLGDLLDHEVKVAREIVLTAFSIYPTQHRFNRILDMARRSGYKVLDTGQGEWKCRLHPPVEPTDDLQWICPECGQWMCEPVLTDPSRVNNIPLQEALQECLLDIPLTIRDDLVVCLSNPRYQILSWGLSWDDLHKLCIFYLNDPEKTKNFVTDLKFIKIKLDYSKFVNIKREPVDEYPGIEKGYEQYLDIDFNPEEENSTVSDNAPISTEDSDENGDNSPLSPSTSNPDTLKSLRMYRPNLKRKNMDGQILIQEKELSQTESKVARIASTDSSMTSEGNSSDYKPQNVLATSYISQILPSCTQSYRNQNCSENFEATTFNNIFNDFDSENNSIDDIELKQAFINAKNAKAADSENNSIDEVELETDKQDIINSKNAMAATLPQLGEQVAQKQLSQVPYQHQLHKVEQFQRAPMQSYTVAKSSLDPNGESLERMKRLKVQIIPLEHPQSPPRKNLVTKQNLTQVLAPSVMKQGFPQTVLESPVSAPTTLNIIPDLQQTPSAPNQLEKNLASMKSAKDLVVLLHRVPELKASLAATQPKFLLPTAKSTIPISTPEPVTIAYADSLLPTPKSTVTCSPELKTSPSTSTIALSTTELNVSFAYKPAFLASLVMSPIELNTVIPEQTICKTEVDLLMSPTELNTVIPEQTICKTEVDLQQTTANTETTTMTSVDFATPLLAGLTTCLPKVDLLPKTTLELEDMPISTTNLVPNMTPKLDNLATSTSAVNLLTASTTALDILNTFKTDLHFSSKFKTEPDVLAMHKAGFKTLPSLPNLSNPSSSTASAVYSVTKWGSSFPQFRACTKPPDTCITTETLATCTTPETLETCTTAATLETCTTAATLETCTTAAATLLTKNLYIPQAPVQIQPETLPNLTSHQDSPTAVVRPVKTLETCTAPEATLTEDTYAPQTHPPQAPVQIQLDTTIPSLTTCKESQTAVVCPAKPRETCKTPEATFLTEDLYPPQTHPPQAPVQIQLDTTISSLTTCQESPTSVVCPVRLISQEVMQTILPGATINQGVCNASVKLEQIQKAPIMAQKVYTIPSSEVRLHKDEVSECDKKTDIQSTKNGQDMASDKIGTDNKTVESASVTIINGADNCSTINNVNTNLSCDNDTNDVPLNDLDEDNIEGHEIVIIVVEELDFPLSETAIFSENEDADIITENLTNIDFTSTNVTAAVLKDIPNSQEIVQENIPEDSLPLDDYSCTLDTASSTSEIKTNNLQVTPSYSQADSKCLNQYESHQKFPKTDVLVQRLESSFVLRDSCNFHKKPKIENLASAIKDNYVKTNKDFQSNISVFSKAKNDRTVKLQFSLDDASESWIPWKWQKTNLKIYSNNRKRKYDSCFKLDNEEKDCKPFSLNFQRSTKQISSPKANVIIANPEYCKLPIILNKYVKKTPFYDFTNYNEIRSKKNTYGRKSYQKYKLVQKTRESIQQPPRILNSEMENFIRSVPGLHDYSEISPTNMTHVVNVVEHGDPRSSTVTNTNTQASTQVTPHIQRIGQAKLDRKTDRYDVDPEPSSSTVMNAPSTSQSTLINILRQDKTSQKSTQPRQTPMVNILSQQIYMPSLDPHQNATVIKVEPEDHADVQATKTVNTNVRIVTTTTQAGATPTTSIPAQGGAILQFICKSSLPKFQQAFGKAVYQPGTTSEVGTSETSATPSEVTNQTQTAAIVETKKAAAKAVPVNVQPITGNVIFRGQVPIGQTVSLIPPGSNTRQLFRITGSTHEQISLVKETVIQNKMSALLAAALQGKPKITEQNGELVEEYSATRITLCRPGSVPPNATRIVKPVQLQIPANVIRTPQPNVSSTTLEQLREFDMVYKQVKERSSNPALPEATPQTTLESSQQQRISFTYVNQVQKYTQLSPVVVVSSYSPIQQAVSPAVSVTSQSGSGSGVTEVATIAVPKVAVKSSKGKSIKSSVVKTSPTTVVPALPKPQQKPQEDEHTTQRIFDILAEYAEQLRNSPDLNNKPAPRRRSNPPTNPSSSASSSPSKKKKKKSTSSSTSNLVETDNEDLTMGSEDSSGGNAVQLSMTDEEQSQSASMTPPESNLEPATSNTTTPRPLIVTDTSSQPRNVIIADSSVGEALKIPSTALLMPGNYIMPVSVVKGGQQIAVVSGGSKILTTVPARSGQNMLLLQSFVNQNKKSGISTVKYSTLQPFSTISQNVTTVTAQTSAILPSNSVSTVSLGQPITLKKFDDKERGNSTELLLTISQPRESVKIDNTEVPQPDSSTNLLHCGAIEVKIEEASSSHLSNNEVFNNIQETNSVATSVIASVIKKDDDEIQTGDSSMKGAGVPRIASVLVNTSTSNGPMLSHTNTRYRKATEGVECTSASTKQFNHNIAKIPPATARVLKNNTVYYAIRTKKAVSKKIDSDMQKQAAIERELRLQKTLSEECEDLGVDEPSTSDLFPEADLLFDSNHSPSYDQSGQRIQGTEAKGKCSLHLFSDDENSEPLRNDLFDYVEYHPPEPGIDQVNGNTISSDSALSCDDSTLLPNCGSMSEVTLNSPISLDYPDNSHKYKYKYTNRKKGEKFNKPPENWQEVTEVTSSEDAMEIVKEDDTLIAVQEETVIDESLTEVEANETDAPKDSVAEAAAARCPIHNSIDIKSPRKALKKICLCFNGTSKSPNTTSAKRRFNSQGPTSCKKVLINKKR